MSAEITSQLPISAFHPAASGAFREKVSRYPSPKDEFVEARVAPTITGKEETQAVSKGVSSPLGFVLPVVEIVATPAVSWSRTVS